MSDEPEDVAAASSCASSASTALGLMECGMPVDDAILFGLRRGMGLLDTLALAAESRDSATFSARTLIAARLYDVVAKTQGRRDFLAEATSARARLQQVIDGGGKEHLRDLGEYFFDFLLLLTSIDRRPMGCM